jgi:hypothetical protein
MYNFNVSNKLILRSWRGLKPHRVLMEKLHEGLLWNNIMNIWSRFPTRAHCGLGTKMKIIGFYPPWKVWQEFNTFDPLQTWVCQHRGARKHKLKKYICFQTFRIQNQCHIDRWLLWGWPWTLPNTVTVSSSLHLHFWWHFLEIKSLT